MFNRFSGGNKINNIRYTALSKKTSGDETEDDDQVNEGTRFLMLIIWYFF